MKAADDTGSDDDGHDPHALSPVHPKSSVTSTALQFVPRRGFYRQYSKSSQSSSTDMGKMCLCSYCVDINY